MILYATVSVRRVKINILFYNGKVDIELNSLSGWQKNLFYLFQIVFVFGASRPRHNVIDPHSNKEYKDLKWNCRLARYSHVPNRRHGSKKFNTAQKKASNSGLELQHLGLSIETIDI